jgi:hypothetical protein
MREGGEREIDEKRGRVKRQMEKREGKETDGKGRGQRDKWKR